MDGQGVQDLLPASDLAGEVLTVRPPAGGDEVEDDLEHGLLVDTGTVLLDGTELGRVEALPRDVPFGYHRLRIGQREQRLLTGPGRCPPGS